MGISSRVDVVMAEGDPAPAEALATTGAPEAVDVAPDPNRRIIMVAASKAAGAERAAALGIDPVAIVTPRSPHAAYGVTADEIVYDETVTAEMRAELDPHVIPCTATSRAE